MSQLNYYDIFTINIDRVMNIIERTPVAMDDILFFQCNVSPICVKSGNQNNKSDSSLDMST